MSTGIENLFSSFQSQFECYKRKWPRFQVEGDVAVMDRKSNRPSHYGSIDNISGGGVAIVMGALVCTNLKTNDFVDLHISTETLSFSAKACVRWIEGCRAGVEFVLIDDGFRAVIHQHVSRGRAV